jgi:hypothetical protein
MSPSAPDAAAWKPAGTSTEAPSGGVTVNSSSAAAAVAGRRRTPAVFRCSARIFSGSRLTRVSTGSACVPKSRTSATPASCRSGLVQSGV